MKSKNKSGPNMEWHVTDENAHCLQIQFKWEDLRASY